MITDNPLIVAVIFIALSILNLFIHVIWPNDDWQKLRRAIRSACDSTEFKSTKDVLSEVSGRVKLDVSRLDEELVERVLRSEFDDGNMEYRYVEGGKHYWSRFWRMRSEPVRILNGDA